MAHVQKLIRRGKTRWQARYRDPAGKERTRLFDRRLDAERWLASAEASKLSGEWTDPTLGKTTVGVWAERWLETKRALKSKTLAGYRSLLDSRLLPAFADVPLHRLERVHVEQWVASMVGDGLSASRVRQAHQLLAAMLDAAVDSRYVPRNVARRVELPRVVRSEPRFLTADQVVTLADAIDKRYRSLVLVLAYGGLRWGEAVALRRDACDLLRRRLVIREAATEVSGRLVFGQPKTYQIRAVTLPAFVTIEVARHLESVGALVWTADRGGPLRYNTFQRLYWRPAVSAAGLENVAPHALRHTCASLLIAAGADPKAVQAQLGHSSIQVTFDVYGHLFEGHLDDVMGRLERGWSEAGAEHTRNVGGTRVRSLREKGS